MVQWKGLKSICCGKYLCGVNCSEDDGLLEVLMTFLCSAGVVNMSFPLSDQPVFGEWFIFVEVQGHTYNKSFEVQKYGEALPRELCTTLNSKINTFCFVFYHLVMPK